MQNIHGKRYHQIIVSVNNQCKLIKIVFRRRRYNPQSSYTPLENYLKRENLIESTRDNSNNKIKG